MIACPILIGTLFGCGLVRVLQCLDAGRRPRPMTRDPTTGNSCEGAEQFAPGMVRFRGKPWVVAVARKKATCWLSGNPIVSGDRVWRPLTNCRMRHQRILVSEVPWIASQPQPAPGA
jgi:hypothetical protein